MARIDVKLAAAIAEVVASIAVVISLLFVVYSVDQNTDALQAANDNVIYELQSQRVRDVSNSDELASIILKYRAGEELSPTEELRYRLWTVLELQMWELAYIRFKKGLLPAEQWNAWNDGWAVSMPLNFPEEWWVQDRYQYNVDFAAHVDAVYSKR